MALPTLIPLAIGVLSFVSSFFGRRNRNLEAIEQQLRLVEEARRRAEQIASDAREAQEHAEDAQRGLEQNLQAEMEAVEQLERARDEARRQAEQAERDREKAERDKENADQRATAAGASASRERQRAEEERRTRERAELELKQAEHDVEKARADREKAEKNADNARIAQVEADLAAQKAKEEADEAKKNLKDGIQPVEWPTAEEYARTLRERQYQEGMFHFAIAGTAGSGKSSLINAFRGILNDTSGAAATGITETTLNVGRYPDPNASRPWIWYDIPGAGTLKITDWQYFNKQGLYIFDAIILLFDNRFTATDVAILRNCARWKIPCFIVRSKSDTQIKNIRDTKMDKIEADETIDEDEHRAQLEVASRLAVEEYAAQTRENVKKNLVEDGLEVPERIYLISYKALLSTIRGREVRGTQCYLDEANLVADMLQAAKEGRRPQPAAMEFS